MFFPYTTLFRSEIVESEVMIDETNGHFQNVCNMLRAWKNEQGFKFGGLLVDTLVYNFFLANKKYYATTFSEYPELLKDLLDRKSTRLNSSHVAISYAV